MFPNNRNSPILLLPIKRFLSAEQYYQRIACFSPLPPAAADGRFRRPTSPIKGLPSLFQPDVYIIGPFRRITAPAQFVRHIQTLNPLLFEPGGHARRGAFPRFPILSASGHSAEREKLKGISMTSRKRRLGTATLRAQVTQLPCRNAVGIRDKIVCD